MVGGESGVAQDDGAREDAGGLAVDGSGRKLATNMYQFFGFKAPQPSASLRGLATKIARRRFPASVRYLEIINLVGLIVESTGTIYRISDVRNQKAQTRGSAEDCNASLRSTNQAGVVGPKDTRLDDV